MAPVRSVRAGVGVGAGWRRDNRPDFPGIAVWVDAVAEIEIDAEGFAGRSEGRGSGFGRDGFAGADDSDGFGGEVVADGGRLRDGSRATSASDGDADRPARRVAMSEDLAADLTEAERVPWSAEAWSPEYAKVWRPLSGTGREPRPGLLLSVVRAGVVVAYPTPLPDPPTGALARALSRLERPEPPAPVRRAKVLAVEAQPAKPQPRRALSQKSYSEVRALVGILIEVLVGRRAAAHAAHWTDPKVRGTLRTPRYARTASLKSVRLAESGSGVEATALLRDGSRTRVVALRFDRADDSRWCCTALQAG